MTITVVPATLPNGNTSEAYGQALGAAGGTAPYNFTLTSGTLPNGLTLSADIISGQPTTKGTFNFTITATDNLSATGTRDYTVAVTELVEMIVEDGTVVEDANAYFNQDDWYDLLFSQGIQLTEEEDATPDDVVKLLIIQATAYTERRFRFYGLQKSENQTMEWPRTKNYDNRGKVIPPGTIPLQLKQGIALLAYQAISDEDLLEADAFDSQSLISAWSTDGVSIDFDTDAVKAANNLFEVKVPDVEILLRSIGELKQADLLESNRQTWTR